MAYSGIRKTAAVLAVLLICSGCGGRPAEAVEQAAVLPETETGEVSSAFRGFWKCGIGEEGRKESGVVSPDVPVEFADPVTEEMLRNLIGKPEGDVLRSELQKIHAIYWRSDRYWSDLQVPDGTLPKEEGQGPWTTRQPETLQDFALCDNLQWLEFGSIRVPSLAPLASLTQLELVGFSGADVAEEQLEELALLPALEKLCAGTGAFTEPEGSPDGSFLLPLADRLTYLEAGGGIQWNPEVLSQLQNLEYLFLEYAEDLSFLPELTHLKNLSLYACTAADWTPLGAAVQLEHLVISGNMDTEISVTLDDLRPLKNLDYLALTMVKMTKEHSRGEITEALPGLTGLCIL